MNAVHYLFLLSFVLCPALVFGVSVKEIGTPLRVIEAGDHKISVYPKLQVKLSEKEPAKELHLTGAGLRKKTVVLIKAKVYTAASYLDKPGGFQSTSYIDEIAKSETRALHLTFVRDLSSEKMQGAFIDALSENGLDGNKPPFSEILSKVTFSFKEGTTTTLIGVKQKTGGETLYLIGPGGQEIIASGPTLATDFWKIWFGKPADGGLEDLREELVKIQ